MGKKSKSKRSSKKNLPKNAAWLEERLESTMLDLEALSAMPINDVNAELKTFKPDQKAFVESLNEKLPAGASISVPKTLNKKPRRKPQARKAGDRKATTSAQSINRKPSRIFSFRSAFVLSLIIIASAVFIPKLIRDFREDKFKSATAIDNNSSEELNKQPTWIVGPAVDELVRGVKYTIEGLEQVVLRAPLPTNPGDLTAKYEMQATIDSNGRVVRLEPLSPTSTDFEPTVIDSLLQWKFSALPDSDQLNDAVITIEYLPE